MTGGQGRGCADIEAGPVEILDQAILIRDQQGRGFAPLRRYRWPQRLHRRQAVGLLRLKDWLRLLGFEINGGMFGCYAPPLASDTWLSRFAFMEKAGARWWPIAGGVYVVRAVKRTAGMRLVPPAWRRERVKARALAPVTNSNGHANQTNDA